MFKFLKGVVAGSGTGPKDLPYNIGEPYSSAWGSWTHSRGTSKVSSFFHLIRFSDCRIGSDPSRPVLLSNSRSRLVRFDELFWKLLFVCGIGIGASLLGFWIWFWVQFRFLPRLMRSCYGWSGFWIVSWFLVCAIQFWRVGKLRDGKNIWSWLLIWYILFLRSLSGSSIAQSRAEIKLYLEMSFKIVRVCLSRQLRSFPCFRWSTVCGFLVDCNNHRTGRISLWNYVFVNFQQLPLIWSDVLHQSVLRCCGVRYTSDLPIYV